MTIQTQIGDIVRCGQVEEISSTGLGDKAKKKAKNHFKKWITELGWTKQAKVTHIEVIKNEKSYFPEHIVVSKSELSPARKRRSTPQTQQKTPRTPRTRRVSRKS